MIRPKGCGLLCITCISRRLTEQGIKNVPVWLCGTEPLKALIGRPGDDNVDNVYILRNWQPEIKETAMEAVIVGSKKRKVLELTDWSYIYIPMTAKEAKLFAPSVADPCWRIEIPKEKGE